jgi:hypothetical protein
MMFPDGSLFGQQRKDGPPYLALTGSFPMGLSLLPIIREEGDIYWRMILSSPPFIFVCFLVKMLNFCFV